MLHDRDLGSLTLLGGKTEFKFSVEIIWNGMLCSYDGQIPPDCKEALVPCQRHLPFDLVQAFWS